MKKTVYHGDNYGTEALDVKWMNNGNNQEGIGIYFGTLDTAMAYGEKIVRAEIDPDKFILSREPIGDYLSAMQIFKILKDMYLTNSEAMFYLASDWIPISKNQEISEKSIFSILQRSWWTMR